MRSPALALLTLALSTLAFAGDGVLEINQACAESATGCFSGDTMGFPVTISTAGSYRLTSNLDQPAPTTDVIVVDASDVRIDLNGFSIVGTNSCSVVIGSVNDNFVPTSVGCTTTSGGSGVKASASVQRVSVVNGFVHGLGGTCVIAVEGVVRDLVVSDCGGSGINNSNGIIRDSRASRVSGSGVFASIVEAVWIRDTGLNGVQGSNITRALVNGAAGDCFSVSSYANVHSVGASLCGGSGIRFASSTPGLVRDVTVQTTGEHAIESPVSILAVSGSNLSDPGTGQSYLSGSIQQIGTNICGPIVCP